MAINLMVIKTVIAAVSSSGGKKFIKAFIISSIGFILLLITIISYILSTPFSFLLELFADEDTKKIIKEFKEANTGIIEETTLPDDNVMRRYEDFSFYSINPVDM